VRDQEERRRLGAGGTMADVGKVVRPRVDELKDVVATTGVGHVEAHGPAAHVDVRD
jgi:hypothetical protein